MCTHVRATPFDIIYCNDVCAPARTDRNILWALHTHSISLSLSFNCVCYEEYIFRTHWPKLFRKFAAYSVEPPTFHPQATTWPTTAATAARVLINCNQNGVITISSRRAAFTRRSAEIRSIYFNFACQAFGIIAAATSFQKPTRSYFICHFVSRADAPDHLAGEINTNNICHRFRRQKQRNAHQYSADTWQNWMAPFGGRCLLRTFANNARRPQCILYLYPAIMWHLNWIKSIYNAYSHSCCWLMNVSRPNQIHTSLVSYCACLWGWYLSIIFAFGCVSHDTCGDGVDCLVCVCWRQMLEQRTGNGSNCLGVHKSHGDVALWKRFTTRWTTLISCYASWWQAIFKAGCCCILYCN